MATPVLWGKLGEEESLQALVSLGFPASFSAARLVAHFSLAVV
jgi:hypothetical protein